MERSGERTRRHCSRYNRPRYRQRRSRGSCCYRTVIKWSDTCTEKSLVHLRGRTNVVSPCNRLLDGRTGDKAGQRRHRGNEARELHVGCQGTTSVTGIFKGRERCSIQAGRTGSSYMRCRTLWLSWYERCRYVASGLVEQPDQYPFRYRSLLFRLVRWSVSTIRGVRTP